MIPDSPTLKEEARFGVSCRLCLEDNNRYYNITSHGKEEKKIKNKKKIHNYILYSNNKYN